LAPTFGRVDHPGEHVAALGAMAYTQRSDIHFAPGHYDPHSRSRKKTG
jgi:hypothetical protein